MPSPVSKNPKPKPSHSALPDQLTRLSLPPPPFTEYSDPSSAQQPPPPPPHTPKTTKPHRTKPAASHTNSQTTTSRSPRSAHTPAKATPRRKTSRICQSISTTCMACPARGGWRDIAWASTTPKSPCPSQARASLKGRRRVATIVVRMIFCLRDGRRSVGSRRLPRLLSRTHRTNNAIQTSVSLNNERISHLCHLRVRILLRRPENTATTP